jgi:hypothetical protein
MLAGWPLDQLVKFVQVDSEEMTDIEPANLVTMLRDYRKTIPPGDFISQTPPPDIVQQRMRPYHEEAIKKVNDGLNELTEIERLYRRQMARIEIDAAVEKKQKKLIPSMTQEMRIAKEFLESSMKIKMDLGLHKRHLGVMETEARLLQEVTTKYGEQNLKALEDSKSRQRLAGAVQALDRFLLSEGDKGDSSILEELAELLPEEGDDPVDPSEEEYEFPEHPGYRDLKKPESASAPEG